MKCYQYIWISVGCPSLFGENWFTCEIKLLMIYMMYSMLYVNGAPTFIWTSRRKIYYIGSTWRVFPFQLELTTPSRMLRAHRTMLLWNKSKRRGKFFNMYTTLGDHWLLQIQVERCTDQKFWWNNMHWRRKCSSFSSISRYSGNIEFLEANKDSSHPQR